MFRLNFLIFSELSEKKLNPVTKWPRTRLNQAFRHYMHDFGSFSNISIFLSFPRRFRQHANGDFIGNWFLAPEILKIPMEHIRVKNTVVYHRLSDVRLSAFANFRQHPQIVRFRKFLGNYTLFRHFFCKNRKFCYFSACFLCWLGLLCQI